MLDIKQNRDMIVVYCDTCASTIRLYASGLTETLEEAIKGCGWAIGITMGKHQHGRSHTCRACIRKGVDRHYPGERKE